MKLLFDCDGTILDSMHVWINPMNEIFSKYGFAIEDLSEEEKGRIEAMPYEPTLRYIADEIATDMTYEEVKSYFDESLQNAYANTLEPKEGAVEILTKLHDEGFKMAVTSSTNYPLLEVALKRIGIFDYFDFFATPDITGHKKSDAEYWMYAADKFEVEPSELMLFDDALYAVKAAGSIGIKTTGIKDYPWNEKEWDQIVKASDVVLENIADIDIDSLR